MFTNPRPATGKQSFLNLDQIRECLKAHLQQRENSCFQSGPEMALKLAGIISGGSYPFQKHTNWDGQGLEPFNGKEHIVEGTTVRFTEKKFADPHDQALDDLLSQELWSRRYPVLSLDIYGDEHWHGYVVVQQTPGDFMVVTKLSPGDLPPEERLRLHPHLLSVPRGRSRKTECLVYEVVEQ